MAYNLVEELRWRGLLQDIVPDTEEYLSTEKTSGYIGFDPTAKSLHVGSMIQIVLLKHLLRAGHRPIALVGGATGRVGDPSGKSAERNLLSISDIEDNIHGMEGQMRKYLSEEDGEVLFVNNYDWFKDFGFLDFIRDVGKHLTVNYMMGKESVKKRIEGETGISFTEFSYQLIQGYDFLKLYELHGCKLQMGGSDQWGNMTTGIELIRRINGGKAYAMTTPLIQKADGSKFGKSEQGNVWLDPTLTSPYQFYQFWINMSDEDSKGHLRKFTFLSRQEIENLEGDHESNPGGRLLQKKLAREVTAMVHSEDALSAAKEATEVFFSNSGKDAIMGMSKNALDCIYDDVPHSIISRDRLSSGLGIIDLLAEHSSLVQSKGDARRALKENSISLNKEKVKEDFEVQADQVIKDQYLVLQRGKKKYHLIKVEG